MEKDIGKINKNDTADIIIRMDDFGGRKGLTIREFITTDRYTGFTKSGVRILAADVPKFKEMINSITDEDLKEEEKPEETSAEVPSQEAEPLASSSATNQPKEQATLDKPKKTKEKPEESKENLPDY